MSDTILLIDNSYLLHRTLHIDKFSNMYNGSIMTGGIFGTLKAVHAVVSKFDPISVISVNDSGRSKRRMLLYPEYKSHRIPTSQGDIIESKRYFSIYNDQRSRLIPLYSALGIYNVHIDNKEGDDIISFISSIYPGLKFIIISEDWDFMTLISRRVSLYRPRADILITTDNFYDITQLLSPRHFLWNKAIIGDSSDNISSISGVGAATSKAVLMNMPKLSMDDLINTCNELGGARMLKLSQSTDIILRNLELIDTQKELFFSEAITKLCDQLEEPFNVDEMFIQHMFNKYGFMSIIRNINKWIMPFLRLQPMNGI